MVPSRHPIGSARGAGSELWLLRAGTSGDLEERLRDFAGVALELVLAPPGGAELVWAERFARARAAPLEHAAELREGAPCERDDGLAERAWPALERALSAGHARILAVLPGDVLRVVVARALGFPYEHSSNLRVDPGRAVLLRDDPLGLMLRRSNVCVPETHAGTPLPGVRGEGAR